ncbi:MAG: DUF4434 domain-containing protein [Cyclobacteriaceae bacterium]|nr:DUF4434 domain-containing protein [Cyclobacteriaceae bacterium]MCH8516329.1 DUF4434 domain-containing protein [Cyclobacteriaceae bacterium]
MKITGTFIDEISHDIPHQNWGEREWDQDFQHMKAIGIDTVILIRCGYRKFITYPSAYLQQNYACYSPPVDLVDLYLKLADKYGMKFYFGLYDSGKQWDGGTPEDEVIPNREVVKEVWERYGHYRSFKGWYLSMEISRRVLGAAEAFRDLGLLCKKVSNGLPTLISPWMDGKKAVLASSSQLNKEDSVSLKEHEYEWRKMFQIMHEAIDAVAFQDGHLDYDELPDFFRLNKKLADEFGLECWTNAETFDRDMPIKFMPIKFEKLKLKLDAARDANFKKAITFEFSHFMSPQSAYRQAGHLYNRYKEYVSELDVS